MNDENKHKWEEKPVPENLKDTFRKKWVCIRCNCERLQSKYDNSYLSYSREMIHYGSTRPDCFGSVPINEQTID